MPQLFKTYKLRFIYVLAVLVIAATVLPSYAANPVPSNNPSNSQTLIPIIESTSYSVPTNSIFVDATNGKLANTGLSGSPLPSLNLALSKSKDGDTIVVSNGIYREGNLSITKRITIQAAQGAQVWFDGTVVTSGWTYDAGGGFKLSNSPSNNLCTAGTGCLDHPSQIDPAFPMSYSPQMVFVNDVLLNEVSSRALAASGNNFYYDIATNTIYIGIDPTNKKVEVTTQRKFADLSSATATIRGIGIRRFGSNLAPSKVQNVYSGAALQVAQGGMGRPNNILIENNTFFQNASRGMSISYADNPVVRGNVFLNNGSNGFDAFQVNNLLVEKNLIRGSNTANFNTSSGESSVIAGSKMVKVYNGVIKDNVFEYNNGTGVWCDLACTGMKYYRNVIHDNKRHGIFYELSDTGTIASNLIYNNSGNGVKLNSPNTKVINNTLYNNQQNIALYEDPRTPPTDPYGDTRNNIIVNNILYGSNGSGSLKLLEINGFNNPDSVTPNLMATEIDYNAYYRASATNPVPSIAIGYTGATVSKMFATVNLAKQEPTLSNGFRIEPNGYGEDGGIKPVFVNASGFNFNLASGSSAINTGKPLSGTNAYIAQDLGLTAGSSINRGAISWPGKTNETVTTTTTIAPTTQAPTTQVTTTTLPVTTTTKISTTTTVPITTTTKLPPPPTIDKVSLAIQKMTINHNLEKAKIYNWTDPYLKARLYIKYSGFIYAAADVTAKIDALGNYEFTNVSWILSFTPII